MPNESTLPTTRRFLTSLFDSFTEHTPANAALNTPNLNPIATAPPALKSLFLTLHVLFPHELLPALDVLDRRLVTRLVLDPTLDPDKAGVQHPPMVEDCQAGTPTEDEEPRGTGSVQDATDMTGNEALERVYYVRSSQPVRSSRYSNYSTESGGVGDEPNRKMGSGIALGGTSYEVRLTAWNCSCPAFAFSAFSGMEIGDVEQDAVQAMRVENDKRRDGEIDVSGEKTGQQFGGMTRGEAVPVCKHLLACLLVEKWPALEGSVEVVRAGRAEMAGWAAGWGG